ncbi:MAG TPA: MmgE/PrpD family protein [Candidatus Sulfotelmatobacter sp.]|nr:MmgE/PrpD family protein [Candidatus Sulfotelmatobacter sp.]
MTARAARAAAAVPVTQALAERSAALRYDDIPTDVRELARQCLLDWFAVTLAGSREDLSRILLEEALEQGGRAQATLIGHAARTATQQAALVNGAASHALDYDDVNMALTGHPTVAIVPGLLALAEARGAGGAEVVAAFVAGYETLCRIGRLVAPGHYERGFHSTGTVGSFGAAAACAHLLGLGAAATAVALGIAGTQAAGLKSMFGTMCKPLHAGKAAQNGLLAATLAAKGFTARPDVLECAQGFAATQSPDFAPDAALADPAGGYHLRHNLFKYHAACYLTHAPIECARELVSRHAFTPDEVDGIQLKIDAGADKVCNIPAPRTGLEAKFSLRLTSAFALAGVDTARLDTYSDERTRQADLVRLRDKVKIAFEAGMPSTLAEMRVALKDGRTVQARHDSGVPASDVAAQGLRVEAKFFSLAEPVIGRAQAERLAEAVHGLDRMERIDGLARLAVPGSN